MISFFFFLLFTDRFVIFAVFSLFVIFIRISLANYVVKVVMKLIDKGNIICLIC